MSCGLYAAQINRFCVLICAFNESASVGQVVAGALKQNPWRVVVVDDGSQDDTAELAQKAGAHVIRNKTNLGKGASLRIGFAFISKLKTCDAIVVLDADGEHDPDDIPRFLETYGRTGIPVLIGNRMAAACAMRLRQRLINRFLARIMNRLVNVYVADPACGFRFYRTDVLPFIMSKEDRSVFEFDVLVHAALRSIRIDSVRISVLPKRKRRDSFAPFRDAVLLCRVVWHHCSRARYDRAHFRPVSPS